MRRAAGFVCIPRSSARWILTRNWAPLLIAALGAADLHAASWHRAVYYDANYPSAWISGSAMRDSLAAAGYEHYEVSNFAQPGFESRHNRVYWQDGDYLGLGPAAHSSMSGQRFWNEPSLDSYVSRTGAGHILARNTDEGGDSVIEKTMLALRTSGGAPRAWCAT